MVTLLHTYLSNEDNNKPSTNHTHQLMNEHDIRSDEQSNNAVHPRHRFAILIMFGVFLWFWFYEEYAVE